MKYAMLTKGLKKGHIIRMNDSVFEIYAYGINQYVAFDKESIWSYFYHGDGDLIGEYVEMSAVEANEIIEKHRPVVESFMQKALNLATFSKIILPQLSGDMFEDVICIITKCLDNPEVTDFVLEGLFPANIIGAAKYDYRKKKTL